MSQTPIEFKGSSFTLSVVHLHHSQPEVIRQALQDKIDQAPAFLLNAPVVLNVSALTGDINWKQMQQAVMATGLRIVGVSGCKDEALKKMIARAGLPVLSEGKESRKQAAAPVVEAAPVVPAVIAEAASKTRIINTPVRSGQQIYARNADLIVTSSVSAGAELVADGNIHIYGMMRGRALAGVGGQRDSQIFCTNLAAELVSIAGEYWMMDHIPAEFFGKAARLSLQDGALTIQTLN
ncbi:MULTISPECIES: septum site-determining protein MinC [Enterobacterales]|jgi:septum site-determining protein MinC|uniref:Probable septum site-determining protein MinC n=1 Tax=Candidatus Pantoea symbiotica TaxID=1884370 RepID=A0A1I3TFH0_9GAMM|nr:MULTISPECIES: septum site-determining protein MinC [Enterobacterales]MRS20709.1 septum site-determining protein MinC [Enterobacteriaceae bacterium RIT692]MRT42479.1 septum site-determining protein MinC [Enterobacteriaceae bacterium RIT702]KAJ9432899.1 septum site-determining protein MinC [Pantoea sp. YR343]MBB3303726.1 septum site-determining protein MinC [Enterobacter sp. Sphag1F]MEA5103779.1 septum site-determining protein MinC [Pantoea sp. S18]